MKSYKKTCRASGNFTVAMLFCLALLGRITADKMEIKDFPKLPWTTSFIRKLLYASASPNIL